jgi:hypothetical protein
VLDDLAVSIEAKDVDARIVVDARPLLVAVEHHVVVLGDSAPNLDVLPGVFASLRSKYSMKASLPSATPGLCWRYSAPA